MKEELVFKGIWIEYSDDSYLDDCYENKTMTIGEKYTTLRSYSTIKGDDEFVTVLNNNGEYLNIPISKFYTLDQWRDIKIKTLGI